MEGLVGIRLRTVRWSIIRMASARMGGEGEDIVRYRVLLQVSPLSTSCLRSPTDGDAECRDSSREREAVRDFSAQGQSVHESQEDSRGSISDERTCVSVPIQLNQILTTKHLCL